MGGEDPRPEPAAEDKYEALARRRRRAQIAARHALEDPPAGIDAWSSSRAPSAA